MIVRILVVLIAIAGSYARPQVSSRVPDTAHAVITSYEITRNELGEYSYTIKTSDNQVRTESRKVIDAGTDHETAVVNGFYYYAAPNGIPIRLRYTADENGFRAEGDHLLNSADARTVPPFQLPTNCVKSLCVNQIG